VKKIDQARITAFETKCCRYILSGRYSGR